MQIDLYAFFPNYYFSEGLNVKMSNHIPRSTNQYVDELRIFSAIFGPLCWRLSQHVTKGLIGLENGLGMGFIGSLVDFH